MKVGAALLTSNRTEIAVVSQIFESKLFIESTVRLERVSGQGWLPILLPLAMASHEDLSLEFAIDPKLTDNCLKASHLLSNWFSNLNATKINAPRALASAEPKGVGLFFSGGVDSFATLIEHQAEITHLVFVIGFDIKRSETKLAHETIQNIKEIARLFEKELIIATTNIRETSDLFLDWGQHYFGAALAGVALVHSHLLKKVIIPSSFSEKNQMPWGSHPKLDPLWSSSTTEIFHDSVEESRYEKVRTISSNEAALKYLRVCWQNPAQAYNCGVCEKCLRTMIALRAFEALERSSSLPKSLNLLNVQSMKINSTPSLTFALENLRGLKNLKERDLPLEKALKIAIARSWPARMKRRLFESLGNSRYPLLRTVFAIRKMATSIKTL